MKTRPLLINDKVLIRVHEIQDWAKANIVTTEQIQQMMRREIPSIGNSPECRMIIPIGYRVVYSIEAQPPGLCDHISVSVEDTNLDCLPSTIAVETIMQLFGMPKLVDCIAQWVETINEGDPKAINVLALQKGAK
jgi:hypothetical protein